MLGVQELLEVGLEAGRVAVDNSTVRVAEVAAAVSVEPAVQEAASAAEWEA